GTRAGATPALATALGHDERHETDHEQRGPNGSDAVPVCPAELHQAIRAKERHRHGDEGKHEGGEREQSEPEDGDGIEAPTRGRYRGELPGWEGHGHAGASN